MSRGARGTYINLLREAIDNIRLIPTTRLRFPSACDPGYDGRCLDQAARHAKTHTVAWNSSLPLDRALPAKRDRSPHRSGFMIEPRAMTMTMRIKNNSTAKRRQPERSSAIMGLTSCIREGDPSGCVRCRRDPTDSASSAHWRQIKFLELSPRHPLSLLMPNVDVTETQSLSAMVPVHPNVYLQGRSWSA